MQYAITLKAGVEKRVDFIGSTLVMLETVGADLIDLSISVNGTAGEVFRGLRRGFKFRGPTFSGATFKAATDCTIQVVVSNSDISVNYTDGATVAANIIGTVPVSNDRGGNVGAPLYVTGLTYTDTPAVANADGVAVAVGAAATVIVAADITRRALRFLNLGPDPVAIGSPGITWAKRTIVLDVGDVYLEDRGANLAWSAICDAGKAASVTAQKVTA